MKSIIEYNKAGGITLCLLLLLLSTSCEKLIEISTPKSQLTSDKVFIDDQTAYSAMAGVYRQFSGFFHLFFSLGTELAADNAIYRSSGSLADFNNNSLTSSNSTISSDIWSPLYQNIYRANRILEGLQLSNGVSEEARQQIEGEAKFVRAFAYFYLVNTFGDVPIVTSTNVIETISAPRANKDDVYSLVISDLEDSAKLLTPAYITDEKVRPNQWAAKALLARAYLYTQNWVNAEKTAGEVINSEAYNISPINGVFLKNSDETIFQLWQQNGFSFYGQLLIPSNPLAIPSTVFTVEFVESFEPNDQRRDTWTRTVSSGTDTYYSPYKYRQRSITTGDSAEYEMILRLAEVYLIRAEARAMLNDIEGAMEDLNVIRVRADISVLSASVSQNECLLAIEEERRHELFFEWGHRWFDLKRTGRVDAVVGAIKTDWQPANALFPIPQQEIGRNPNLTQNSGY